MEWEEALELVSLKLSAHWASANGRNAVLAAQRSDIWPCFACGVGFLLLL